MSYSNNFRHFRFPTFRSSIAGMGLAAFGLVQLWAETSDAVGTRHFIIESGDDFEKGEFSAVAVDSSGFLRSGWELSAIEVSGAQNVWDALEHDGNLYLATGNEGKLFVVRAGKAKQVASADALALTSIVHAFGKVLVGAMPGGKLYELKGEKLVEFAQLEGGEHIWDLAFDAKTQVLYAATGPEGKLYRITGDGTAQVYFDAPEGHLMSVAAGGGRVFVGSSGEARLYEVTGPGRGKVLHDFSATEVRDIAIGKNGDVFVIVNELKGGARSDSLDKDKPQAPRKATAKKGKGAVYGFYRSLSPEELYSDSSEHFVSLTLDDKGRPIVGTGSEGKVIRLGGRHDHAVLADVDERQVSQVLRARKGGWVIASDPIVVHGIQDVGGQDAVWTSEALDAGIRARFGQLTWDASGNVEFSTRTGNTEEPDETWTDWSSPISQYAKVTSDTGRYLQVRVRLIGGEEAQVRRIDIPFVTENLRPVVTAVTAESTAQVSGSAGITTSGGPLDDDSSSVIKLSWDVKNPDEDELRYRVEFRREDQSRWFDALKPGTVHTSKTLKWETEDLPEGRYRVRVSASDELSNPPGKVRTHQLQSEVVLVDNTPPRLNSLRITKGKLMGQAVDGLGPLKRLELRLAGQKVWIPFEPKDGIFDQSREDFEVDVSKILPQTGGLLTVRAFDTGGNLVVRHVNF